MPNGSGGSRRAPPASGKRRPLYLVYDSRSWNSFRGELSQDRHMSDIELKFVVSEDASRTVWQRARLLGYCERTPKGRSLRSVYFDTKDNALHKAGISLRVRRSGRQWIQSVKRRSTSKGEFSRWQEVENPVAGEAIALDAIADEGLRREIVGRMRGGPLVAVCETRIRRTAGEIRSGNGTRAEMAVDTGEIAAGERVAGLHEVEIELIEGNADDLFQLAKALFPSGGLRFSRHSKGSRGRMLASEGHIEPPLDPRGAEAVGLLKSETVERAARDILRECRQQIATNIRVASEMDDPEGPHQLRVGLRRMRSALSVFGSVLPGAEASRLGTEAQWLGAEVGRLRDFDAVIADVVRPEAERFSEEAGFAPLLEALEAEAGRRRDSLRETLRSERVQTFAFDLVRFIETRDRPAGLDIRRPERLAMPLPEFTGKALDKRWRKARRRCRRIGELTVEERHELRKELKKLRYLTEFFSPLYPKRRVSPFLKRLRELQLLFGEFNDAQVAKRVLDELLPVRPEKPAMVERAAGCAIGASQTRAALDWSRAARLGDALGKTRPFWC